MKQNATVILLIMLMVALPLVTSLLLDWSFIKLQTARQLIVYLLMAIEVAVMILVLLYYLKKISTNKQSV